MKFVICGYLCDTEKNSDKELEKILQERYCLYLGYDKKSQPLVQVKVNQVDFKKVRIEFYRKYGDWFDLRNYDPTTIYNWDEEIIMGKHYTPGGQADFEKHESRFIVWNDIEGMFYAGYKRMSRNLHASRIKELKFDYMNEEEMSFEITCY